MKFKFAHDRLDDLGPTVLKRLHELTNSPLRGDVRDNGDGAGSHFRNVLDDALCGESHPHSWVVVARDRFRVAGWSMVTSHLRDPLDGKRLSVPTGAVGFYVHPDFRRQGLGLCLIQEVSEVARINGMGRLLANPWNRTSNSFFQAAGFIDISPYIPGWAKGTSVLELPPIAAVASGR